MKEKNEYICEQVIIHEEVVERVKPFLPEKEQVEALLELYKGISDGTRLRIMFALQKEEMCVCDISALLGMSQSAISHQLRVLRNARLVKNRKEGKTVYYSLDDEHVKTIFEEGLSHIEHTLRGV